MVDETSGSGNDDVGALLEFGLLNLERETTLGNKTLASGSRLDTNEITHQHRDRTECRCNERERLRRREPAQPAHE